MGRITVRTRVRTDSDLVDWIFRELAIEYAGRDDLAHVAAEDFDQFSISKPEITEQGVMRTEGEKREVQMTLDAAAAPLLVAREIICISASLPEYLGDCIIELVCLQFPLPSLRFVIGIGNLVFDSNTD
jgi:hypothetical protein